MVVGFDLLPNIHPRMSGKHHGPIPTRQLEVPGLFGLHYGIMTPAVTLAAHVVDGVALGAFYESGR